MSHNSKIRLPRIVIGASLAMSLALTTALPSWAEAIREDASEINSDSPSTSDLLDNGDFVDGHDGWRTNGPGQTLSIKSPGDDPVAELTTTSTQNATLNDSPTVINASPLGSTYRVSARVRTSTPGVKGALRIREVASQTRVSQSSFMLENSSWQVVDLEVTSTMARSRLDLNLVAWDLSADQNLQVDWVSMKEIDAAPGGCDVPVPAGTMFGANAWDVGTSLDGALEEIDSAFGPVPVVRHFSPGMPFSWDSSRAQKLRGRDLVVSFKVHPNEITSGRHDAFFRNWFATAPADQTIFWSYFHEPENNINAGEFTKSQYRAAWAHLGQIYDDACRPNMYSTLILTEWTMHPNSGRDYRTYDAGPQAIDMIAFDPYNGVWDPDRDYYVSPEDLLDHIVEKMDTDGRPWGIAEIGSRISVGDNGTGRADWLHDIASYARNHNAVFVTYFHAIGNGDWRLNDQRSRAAWRNAVQD